MTKSINEESVTALGSPLNILSRNTYEEDFDKIVPHYYTDQSRFAKKSFGHLIRISQKNRTLLMEDSQEQDLETFHHNIEDLYKDLCKAV